MLTNFKNCTFRVFSISLVKIKTSNQKYFSFFKFKTRFLKRPIISKMATNFEIGSLSKSTDMKGKINKIPFTDFVKSKNDMMEYRLIQLDNGLQALLVSDAERIIDLSVLSEESEEETDEESENESENESEENDEDDEEVASVISSENEDVKSGPTVKDPEGKLAACALCVGVGSFSDPPDIPGLAHFLEHMVFMGSEKYPQENGFDEFIKRRGGSDNGSTECETTSFYLECSEKHLREGMNRFAQFFISPLMRREAMTREREIIHSEFEMSIPSDGTRREQILGSLAPSGHPSGKFLWGNLTTLRDNVEDNVLYERVHEFQKRHYSAHRMTVAVQARLSLDTLEEYVRESFSEVPTNNLPADDFSSFIGTYGNPSSFNKIVWVKPVKDLCQIHLTWIMPSYVKEYKSRPWDYVSWLIGHEGEGSLLSFLRKKVWALQCEAGNDESGFEHNSIYSSFSVSLTLTEEGFLNVNEVISLVFSYIAMLKENCPSEAVYDELSKICETSFRYKVEIPSASYVEILAESMHKYEPEHYIAGGELYFEFKPELITEILNTLTPDRVNVIIYSKDRRDNFYDRVEPWFQTKHKIEEIPSEWKEKWRKCKSVEEFHMPDPNPYLITDFSLLPAPETNPPYPEKILDDSLMEIWYRQDVKFKQPLAYYSFYILSPLVKSDPLNAVLLDVLTSYLETKFNEQIFPANQAGLNCAYSPSDLGLFLQFGGYSQKLPLLFDEVLKLIHKFCAEIKDAKNEEMFKAIKKDKSRAYYNRFLKPSKLIKMARLSILVDNFWNSVDRFEVMKEVSLQKLHKFAGKFFKEVRILGLLQGNVSQAQAIELCRKFDSILSCSPLKGDKPQMRVTRLTQPELFLRLKSFNFSDSNSVITNYYQVGQEGIRTSCMIDLLMLLMDEPLFDSLRTKQQIGYDVHCLLRDTFGVLAFSITVFFQVNKFHPDEVDDRIEAFLKYFLKFLKTLPKKEWEEAKATLCQLKSIADLQLQDEVKRNFAEICSDEYIFDRLQKEVEIIPDIGHKELCKWFADHIASGKKFRKFSTQAIGGTQESSESLSEDYDLEGKNFALTTMTIDNKKASSCIIDIDEYKKSREFYPPKKSLPESGTSGTVVDFNL